MKNNLLPISKPIIKKAEIDAVVKVLKSGNLVQGKNVVKLESSFSKICGSKYAIATNNGTSALHTALAVLGIGKNDEVITTPFTFAATVNSILMTGAVPVFADIEELTFNINPKEIEKKITKKTKAILAVDLYGKPANYREISEIAKKNKLFVVEDAAQSIGAKYFGKSTGNLTDIACFSLYATKNITSGEGGVITTNNLEFNNKARVFRNQGQDENIRYLYKEFGYNYRMTDLHAAIANEQFKRLNKVTNRRIEIAEIYNHRLSGIKGLILPIAEEGVVSVFHQYTLRITREYKLSRDELKSYLEKKGIHANIYYPIPLYRFNHMKFGNNPKDFPITEKMSKEVLSIPVHPSLSNKDVDYIIKMIKKV